MKTIIAYNLCWDDSLSELRRSIDSYLAMDYQPYGFPYFADGKHFQAMVKYL